MRKKSWEIFFFVFVFVISIALWYSPVAFKGYAWYKTGDLILIARNLNQGGIFGLEDSQNILLPASLVGANGEVSVTGNKLTAYLYAGLFKIFGMPQGENIIFYPIFLNALALLIFTIIVARLFGYKIAAAFAALYVLFPLIWTQIYSVGSYEFGILFLAFFFMFFIFSKKRKNEMIWLSVAGVFAVLAALAKEAFFLLLPVIFFFFLIKKQRRAIFYFFTPVLAALVFFYLPGFLKTEGGSYYRDMFFSRSERKYEDYFIYGHLFPDPYVYHFQRDDFLSAYSQRLNQAGFFERLQLKKILTNSGLEKVNFFERFVLGFILLAGHAGYFLSLEGLGGPLVFLLAFLGLFYLRDKNQRLFGFICFWVLISLFLVSFVLLFTRSHAMDFVWLWPLLLALAIAFLSSLLSERLKLSDFKKTLIFFIFLGALCYHLFLIDRLAFGKMYDDTGGILKLAAYAREIKAVQLSDTEVIAVGLGSKDELTLGYLTDKSLAVFNPETIKSLLAEKKLQQAFGDFGIKYVLGYSDEISGGIAAETGAVIIASDSIKPVPKEKDSVFKLFLLNLFR